MMVPPDLEAGGGPRRRIAYVINSVEGGGAAAPVAAIVRAVQARGADVRVFALARRDGRALAGMADAGVDVIVRAGGRSDHAAALRWLDRMVADWRPDLIWTSLTRATLLGQLVGARRGVPVISWQHNAYLKPGNLALLRLTRTLSKLWLADSSSIAAMTAERLHVDPAEIITLPLFAADPLAPRAAPWRAGEPIRLGSMGRLHPAKGYDVLIEALAWLQGQGWTPLAPFSIEIAGVGSEENRLTARARAAGVTAITWRGFADRPRDFLATLHAYVQPSRREGLCIAAHEAMQAGLPVIGSATGEMPRTIIDGVTGYVVPPGDVVALATAIRSMLDNPARLAAMGCAARDRLLSRFDARVFDAACDEVMLRWRAGFAR